MDDRSSPWPAGLSLRDELRPGDLGRLIALHGEVYRQVAGFGLAFEAFVARTIAEYGLENRFNGRIWLLEQCGGAAGNKLTGCSAIAFRSGRTAQLRWVLLRREWWGRGVGRRMVETALDFCRESGMSRVYLETTDGLEASSALYRTLGFRETANEITPLWDGSRPLIRMEMNL